MHLLLDKLTTYISYFQLIFYPTERKRKYYNNMQIHHSIQIQSYCISHQIKKTVPYQPAKVQVTRYIDAQKH